MTSAASTHHSGSAVTRQPTTGEGERPAVARCPRQGPDLSRLLNSDPESSRPRVAFKTGHKVLRCGELKAGW